MAYLSKNKSKLSKYFTIWTPDWDCIKYCYDKKLTYEIAEKLQIPIPKSYFPKDVSDLSEVNKLFQYPLIIKPAIMHEFYKKTNVKVFVVNNKEELNEKYLNACSIINPSDVIIQEIIQGETKNLYSYCSFFKDGNVVEFITGQLSNYEKTSANVGTNIVVRNLFSNVPARKKFLKSDNVEYKHILRGSFGIWLYHIYYGLEFG